MTETFEFESDNAYEIAKAALSGVDEDGITRIYIEIDRGPDDDMIPVTGSGVAEPPTADPPAITDGSTTETGGSTPPTEPRRGYNTLDNGDVRGFQGTAGHRILTEVARRGEATSSDLQDLRDGGGAPTAILTDLYNSRVVDRDGNTPNTYWATNEGMEVLGEIGPHPDANRTISSLVEGTQRYEVLRFVADSPGCTAFDVAEADIATSSSASAALSSLADSFAVRKEGGKTHEHHITPYGERLLEEAVEG